jgi:NADH-quinone oxidoreductase subunit L
VTMLTSSIPHISLIAAAAAALCPFAAFVAIMLFTRHRPRLSAGLSIAAVTVALVSAAVLLAVNSHQSAPRQFMAQWMVSGDLTVTIGVLLDPVSLLMLAIVTVISFCVQIYSLGYMAGDPGFSRYYGFMSLFAWAMISLTLSPTLLQLYIFWELVGLSSYLLIGFWFEKFSASHAGKKAFVMTRFGDVAFLLGMLLVLIHFGNLDILKLNGPAVAQKMSPWLLTVSALLIFGGIVGKSAQFPLLTWLPDAMEGPTPVSALLHSATMVAAGVYLFSRLFPFLSLSPGAMAVFLAIGTISMLLSSTMAMVSRDIKQVWAYSTISQLGFMIMGLGAGGWFAGMFHLTTHAGFKALLFLCSGVFIHHFETNDMFAIGTAGGRRLKVPMICMVIGAAALSGLPPFSGFFSKEAIMGVLAQQANPLWLAAGLLGAFLTAYYAFRLIFVILCPKSGAETDEHQHPAQDSGHGHGASDRFMAGPLVILAGITVLFALIVFPLESFLAGEIPAFHEAAHPWLPWTAMGLAGAGLVLAWVEFGRKNASQVGFVQRMPAINDLFSRRWYIDDFYRWFLDVVIYKFVSGSCTANDRKVIDAGIDTFCQETVAAGQRISGLHLSMIQQRLAVMFAVVFALALYYFF